MRPVPQSAKLDDVHYAIRGPVLNEAKRMEDEGYRVLKLNIGNPAPFGFEAPEEILVDFKKMANSAVGYSDSKGNILARRAVVQHYEQRGYEFDVDDVYLGNGVSELITISMQALLNNGDEILVPAPDYPLWTASISLSGGTPVHYLCDEEKDWEPDLEDMRAKITDRTRGIVVINPNNPTGAVYSKKVLEGIVKIAREHELILFADEIYDKVLYDDAEHVHLAPLAPDLLCLTYNGLSKAYRVAGFRAGWMFVTGPRENARGYLAGIDMLTNMRLCANHPAQHVISTCLGGHQSITDLVLPGGRLLEQRNVAVEMLRAIPGVTTTVPKGAMYIFPRLDPAVYPIEDDEQFALELLREERVLVVQGSGLNWKAPDHFRLVTLPRVEDLREAIGRIGRFLERRRPVAA
ncbi:MAG: pyridoxal phosphate-dependent aminotransferase [Dermatophilus congolensis]|nr:pyridoxal phosphate-dependent aminotransferase [Dermatophilus congolensis]